MGLSGGDHSSASLSGCFGVQLAPDHVCMVLSPNLRKQLWELKRKLFPLLASPASGPAWTSSGRGAGRGGQLTWPFLGSSTPIPESWGAGDQLFQRRLPTASRSWFSRETET